MEFRSTNDIGYVHHQGDIISNVSSGGVQNSSHGVHLTGGSTGGIVQPAGDEANIALTVRAKAAGPLGLTAGGALNITGGAFTFASSGTVTIGSTVGGGANNFGTGSTGNVTLGSSNSTLLMAGSTAPFSGFLRFIDTAVSTPATFNDTTCGRVGETTHAISALSSVTEGTVTPVFIVAVSHNLPAAVSIGHAWLGSTTGDVHTRLSKGSTVALAGTTCTFHFLVTRM